MGTSAPRRSACAGAAGGKPRRLPASTPGIGRGRAGDPATPGRTAHAGGRRAADAPAASLPGVPAPGRTPAACRGFCTRMVRQSAQPAADRSVQRLVRRRRRTAPAGRWAARPRSCPPWARQRARTDAAPCLTHPPPRGPCGRHRLRCAPPVLLLPVTPNPLQGAVLGSAPRKVGRPPRASAGAASALLRGAPSPACCPPPARAPSPSSHSSRKPHAACVRCGRCQRSRLPPRGRPSGRESQPGQAE